jgi:hypothetical protein
MFPSALSRRTCILSAAIFFCAFTSCIGPHKINKWVAHHYQEEPIEPPRHKSEQLLFVSKLPSIDGTMSETVKSRNKLLPLLFYWKYDNAWSCTLNPDLAVNNFETTVIAAAGHGLKQKLNSNHLELTIQQMPHAFTLDDKGWIVWVIYAFGMETITVQPQPTDLVVAYRVLSANNEEVKTGLISIVDPNRTKPLKWFHSLRNTTLQYLEQYDANTVTMSKELVAKLAAEL